MNPSDWRLCAGAIFLSVMLVACGGDGDNDDFAGQNQAGTGNPDNTPAGETSAPPDENVILLEETQHIIERSVLMSLPSDPDQAMMALSTLPDGLGDVIAMHLGRYYPTPDEFGPGTGPLVDLLAARANLLASGQPQMLLENTTDGEAAILLLPIDATIFIVVLPTQVVESDVDAKPLPEMPIDLSQLTYEINGHTRC